MLQKAQLLVFVVFILPRWCSAQTPQSYGSIGPILFNFESDTLPAGFSFNHVSVTLVKSDTKGYGRGLQLKFDSNHYTPGFMITPAESWDWSGMGESFSLAVDITNTGKHSAQLFLNLYDSTQSATRYASVSSGESDTFYFELTGPALQLDMGMRQPPSLYPAPFKPMTWSWGSKQLNVSQITRLEFGMKSILNDKELVLDNIRLVPNGEYNPQKRQSIIDRFGQFNGEDWPEKIENETDLLNHAKKELAVLDQGSSMPDRSKFGGWKNGPKLEATGYFRTQKFNGRWTLVDPEGYLYFSHGIANVRLANSSTITGIDYKNPRDKEGQHIVSNLRRDLFAWLPDREGKFADHYGYTSYTHMGPVDQGETFSFYGANLQRKYGDDYFEEWQQVTLDRMLNWGFTSFGSWADPAFYGNRKVPYTAFGGIGGDYSQLSGNSDYWGPMHDPFDPVSKESARRTVQRVAERVGDDPWCVGVFIDNELSWGNPGNMATHYGLVMNALSRDAQESPAKAAFTKRLKKKYGNIQSLNEAWNVEIELWEDFEDSFGSDKPLSGTMEEDYSDLLFALADQYFSIVSEELEKALPNHLYLGSRFAVWGMSPEIVRAAANHVDVVTYNLYTEGLAEGKWDFLAEIDMPSIIGEFHNGTTEGTGLFHGGLVAASDRKNRGTMYKRYMESVIENPYFVGAHWFQYFDSPTTGRAWDGENYNVGFVSVTDVPYSELVNTAKQFNRSLYPRLFPNVDTTRQ